MSGPLCAPEKVTALVDGALDEPSRRALEEHILGCEACRDQEAFERGLHARLRALPPPALPAGLEERVQERVARSGRPRSAAWLALAAGLMLAVLWGRGAAPFLAWELWRDHHHCFDRTQLPAQVWTEDPGQIATWFRERGTELPSVPAAVGDLELVGGRHCPLLDRRVAHLYYANRAHHVSLFVVGGPARVGRGYEVTLRGNPIRLMRTAGVVVGVVGDDAETVDAFRRAFATTVAEGGDAMAPGLTPPPGL
jgi:anti-sigma factor RsiW